MKDKIRQNAKRYFQEELSGEPLYQDLVIDWLTDFAHEQVKIFAMPDDKKPLSFSPVSRQTGEV